MGTFSDFEDIEVWKKARLLLRETYRVTKREAFYRDRGMRDQMRTAALSIMNNISEGNDRQGNREFIQFLSVARGSAGEVRSMLYAAMDQEYIDQNEFKVMYDMTIEISKMIKSLINYLRKSGLKGKKF